MIYVGGAENVHDFKCHSLLYLYLYIYKYIYIYVHNIHRYESHQWSPRFDPYVFFKILTKPYHEEDQEDIS